MNHNGRIVLTSDYLSYKSSLIDEVGNKNLRFFENNDFKIDDARAVMNEAYLAESDYKFILIKADKFYEEAQNSLLKILEEPPRNVVFIIVTTSLNALLPTIRSRMVVQNLSIKKERIPTGLNFTNLTLKDVINIVDEKISLERKGEFDRFKLKEFFMEMVKECFETGIKFNQSELEYIKKLIVLIELNAKSQAVLTPFLLMLSFKNRIGKA